MSPRNRIVAGGLAIVAATAGFWFVLLAPKRTEVSAVTDKIAQAQSRRDAAVTAANQAGQARARYRGDYATVARLGKAVPGDDDVASLIYQIETIARASKIDFRAVKLSGGAGAASAAPTPPAAPANADAEKGEAGDPTAAPANPAAPVVVAQPPPGAVVGAAGLLTVPFTFTFDGDYLEFQRFLKAINGLANNENEKITVRGRLLTVDGFSLAAGPKGFPKLKALVSATAYLVPPDGAAAGATPQSPGGATAAAPGTTAMTTTDAQGGAR